MNKKIGMLSSAVNIAAVVGFAVCMLFKLDSGSYFFSMFIAFSFVPMMCAFAFFSEEKRRLAGYVSAVFAAVYAAIILLVYFAQLTSVRSGGLSPQAAELLDFQRFGLFFSYDMLGYGLMALSTFFAGLSFQSETRADRWLKALLMIHGVFFISCLTIPILGLFKAGGPDWVGIAVLEFWCAFFLPVGLLSFRRFFRQKR